MSGREVEFRVAGWLSNGDVWRTPRAPVTGLHALILADDYAALLIGIRELADKWERIGNEHGPRQFTGNDHLLFANELRVRLLAEEK